MGSRHVLVLLVLVCASGMKWVPLLWPVWWWVGVGAATVLFLRWANDRT